MLIDPSDIAFYEAATLKFFQTFLPTVVTNVDASINAQERFLQNIFTGVSTTLEDQFFNGQELMTLVEVTATTVDDTDLESHLDDLVNDNEDAFINFLGGNGIFSEVVQVTANEPNATSLVGEILIDLSVMEELLSPDSTTNFEFGITSFFEDFLPDIFSDISASLQGQFLDAQTLTTLVQVNSTAAFPSIELLSPFLIDLVNENQDAFIGQLMEVDPESFANVTRVSSGEPVLTPVSGVVGIVLFSITRLLIGSIQEIFETASSTFYEEFLPDIFFDIEASLIEQFLEGQELTAVVQINGTTFTFETDLETYLRDILNEHGDAFVDQLSEIDPVTFGNLTRISAVNLDPPTKSPVFFIPSNENTGGPSDAIVMVVSIICVLIAFSFLFFHFECWARIFGRQQRQQQEPVSDSQDIVEEDTIVAPSTDNNPTLPLRADETMLQLYAMDFSEEPRVDAVLIGYEKGG